MKRVVYFVFDKKLPEISTKISNIGNRAYVVQSLVAAYNLLSKCEIIQGEVATDEDLLTFHSSDYINYLKKAQSSSNLEILANTLAAEDFNLGYDCPLFNNIYDFVQLIAGSSLSAAKTLTPKLRSSNSNITYKYHLDVQNTEPKSYLRFKYKEVTQRKNEGDVFDLPVNLSMEEDMSYNLRERFSVKHKHFSYTKNNEDRLEMFETSDPGVQKVAINWFGGWHHAQRDAAEGFCYINDIVLAILFLLKAFKRILYVDLDIHHGNGVENAFCFSPRVFVLSLHKYETGFYPASGSVDDIGEGPGRFYTANVPLKGGITDDAYVDVFTKIVFKVLAKFKPQCIVIQCGADAIAGDPLGGFNLTPVGLGKCLQIMLDQKLPTLILGGGGYNIPNVARCWTYLTSITLGHPVSNDIPDNSYFHLFGPAFELGVTPTLRRNENSDEYLQEIVQKIVHNLDHLPEIL